MGEKNTIGLVVPLTLPLDSSKIIQDPLVLVRSCGAGGTQALPNSPEQSVRKDSKGANTTHSEECVQAQGGSR